MKNYFLTPTRFPAFEHQFINRMKKNEGVLLRSGDRDTSVGEVVDTLVQSFQQRGDSFGLAQDVIHVACADESVAAHCCQEFCSQLERSGIDWNIACVHASQADSDTVSTVMRILPRSSLARAARDSGLIRTQKWAGWFRFFLLTAAGIGSTILWFMQNGAAQTDSPANPQLVWSTAITVGLVLAGIGGLVYRTVRNSIQGKSEKLAAIIRKAPEDLRKAFLNETSVALLSRAGAQPLAVVAPSYDTLDPMSREIIDTAMQMESGRIIGSVVWVLCTRPEHSDTIASPGRLYSLRSKNGTTVLRYFLRRVLDLT